MQNVMIDCETLSLRSHGVVLSIGATMFDESGQGAEFHAVCNVQEQTVKGAHVDPSTVDWWAKQSEAARRVLTQAKTSPINATEVALIRFSAWWGQQGARHPWSLGADFDIPMLVESFHRFGLPVPWKFWDARCFRTLKGLNLVPAPSRQGTHHDALDDARHQAQHASAILRALRDMQKRASDRAFDQPHHGHGLSTDAAQESVGDAIKRARRVKS